MKNQEQISFNDFLKGHEFFQLALIEAVHRYYHDLCFSGGENSRPKDTELCRNFSDIQQNLTCLTPDWRYRLKKKLERYDAWEPTKALVKDAKPNTQLQISFDVEIHFENILNHEQ